MPCTVGQDGTCEEADGIVAARHGVNDVHALQSSNETLCTQRLPDGVTPHSTLPHVAAASAACQPAPVWMRSHPAHPARSTDLVRLRQSNSCLACSLYNNVFTPHTRLKDLRFVTTRCCPCKAEAQEVTQLHPDLWQHMVAIQEGLRCAAVDLAASCAGRGSFPLGCCSRIARKPLIHRKKAPILQCLA